MTLIKSVSKTITKKQIWLGLITLLSLILVMLAAEIRLAPATIRQNTPPIETPDADTKPTYSPNKDYHWPTKRITYHIKKTTSRHYVNVWRKAVQAWNDVNVVTLVSTKVQGNAEIILGTQAHYQNQPDSWEGETGVVMGYTIQRFGNASGAPIFDDQNESYLITSAMKRMDYTTTNQQAGVAMHELGHDLGLGHSQNNHSIMQEAAPTLYTKIPQVDADHLAQLYRSVAKK
ncbi:peptidase M10 [Lentilactobacillus fungorum]|uniref:Peptidase M10 n=1 Tax=Lentilactobacillus fungorum TaxID=2201250 RepID=A0ABQ3W107_9LACO|nr:matrixin family metalloprotease [Lentilactobacillus fungorum]GHP14202.1 peptidase M10 [Lentilactobacillus fungorum]